MFFKYSYVDAEGRSRIQVNVDGFCAKLSEQGATKVEQTAMTDKQVKAYIRNANKD